MTTNETPTLMGDDPIKVQYKPRNELTLPDLLDVMRNVLDRSLVELSNG